MIIVLGIFGYFIEAFKAIYVFSQLTPDSEINVASVSMGLLSPYMLAPIFIGMLFIALGLVTELIMAKTIQPNKCYSIKKEA